MRTKILTALLVSTLGFGALAAHAGALDSTKAAVTAVDAATGTVTLADGTSYNMPYGFDLSAVQPGKVVNIIWSFDGDDRNAYAVN